MDVAGANSQFLVVGSGLAGLSFALKATKLGDVTILTKNTLLESNSTHAQGGIAAVISPEDSYRSHIEDTLRLGKGLCNREAVELMVKRAPEEVQWLIDLGVDFDRTDGDLDLRKEGGHSARRVAHIGDNIGREIQVTLSRHAQESPRITIHENVAACDLIVEVEICRGVRALDKSEARLVNFYAPVTVLATGGVGQVYSKTFNPDVATRDGVSLA